MSGLGLQAFGLHNTLAAAQLLTFGQERLAIAFLLASGGPRLRHPPCQPHQAKDRHLQRPLWRGLIVHLCCQLPLQRLQLAIA